MFGQERQERQESDVKTQDKLECVMHPPPEFLKIFGGTMDINEYKNPKYHDCQLVFEPFFDCSFAPVIEKNTKPKGITLVEVPSIKVDVVDGNDFVRKIVHENRIILDNGFGIKNVWPGETEALCWNCAHPFQTFPVCIPRHLSNMNVVYGHGIFCSLNCAKRYSLTYMSNINAIPMFSRMHFRSGNRTINGITSVAPPRWKLRVFGGEMSIDEFRKGFTFYDKDTTLKHLCFVPRFLKLTIKDGFDDVPTINDYRKKCKVTRPRKKKGKSLFDMMMSRTKKDVNDEKIK
jgi:hypothetical protein